MNKTVIIVIAVISVLVITGVIVFIVVKNRGKDGGSKDDSGGTGGDSGGTGGDSGNADTAVRKFETVFEKINNNDDLVGVINEIIYAKAFQQAERVGDQALENFEKTYKIPNDGSNWRVTMINEQFNTIYKAALGAANLSEMFADAVAANTRISNDSFKTAINTSSLSTTIKDGLTTLTNIINNYKGIDTSGNALTASNTFITTFTDTLKSITEYDDPNSVTAYGLVEDINTLIPKKLTDFTKKFSTYAKAYNNLVDTTTTLEAERIWNHASIPNGASIIDYNKNLAIMLATQNVVYIACFMACIGVVNIKLAVNDAVTASNNAKDASAWSKVENSWQNMGNYWVALFNWLKTNNYNESTQLMDNINTAYQAAFEAANAAKAASLSM